MVSLYQIKPKFQNVLRPCSNWLAKRAVSANQITVIAVLLSLFTGILLCVYPTESWAVLLVPIALLLRMILNALDGMLAREHQMQTALGTYLNELGDVFSDAFLYLPFCLLAGISPELITTIVVLAIIAEMTGVIALQIGQKRRYDGPMGKSDRALVFGLISILLGFNLISPQEVNYILIATSFLLFFTIINRVNQALREKDYDYQ